MSNLGKIVSARAPGRPTRETTIVKDKCKPKKKKKILSSLIKELTIFAQGDARQKKKKEDWKY